MQWKSIKKTLISWTEKSKKACLEAKTFLCMSPSHKGTSCHFEAPTLNTQLRGNFTTSHSAVILGPAIHKKLSPTGSGPPAIQQKPK